MSEEVTSTHSFSIRIYDSPGLDPVIYGSIIDSTPGPSTASSLSTVTATAHDDTVCGSLNSIR